ncbi:hypothetical protein BG003_003137 [Podila horticola]|nr:hypothetical protein BG003_003137 [Podila horticola]
MITNAVTNIPLTLFCLVDGEATSNAFSIKISSRDTVDDPKTLIRTKKTNDFSDIDANQLTLWATPVQQKSVKDDDIEEGLAVVLEAVNGRQTTRVTHVVDSKDVEAAQRERLGPFYKRCRIAKERIKRKSYRIHSDFVSQL